MKKINLLITCFITFTWTALAQDIVLTKQADLRQAYLKRYQSAAPLPMNELDMESGYVLYESEINVASENAVLELEHVRDYAVVFVEDKLQGSLTDSKKKLSLNVQPGKYKLKLFVENIGRITYGPEILDNSKGLFGSISLAGDEVENWTMTPLNIKEIDLDGLTFDAHQSGAFPCFLKGEFSIGIPADCYLDLSGWGMGEVWINGKYLGAFWEEEKQQSIQIPANVLTKGKNELIVFELKNTQQKNMKITDKPVFH
jgi:hypothetical protein